MLRIQRLASGDAIIFVLSGRIQTENITQLESLIVADAEPIVLDLSEVNLVSRDVVRFLGQCENDGVKIQNCPAYIREWIARE
jgi:anti-anti-sigma regulatory factor